MKRFAFEMAVGAAIACGGLVVAARQMKAHASVVTPKAVATTVSAQPQSKRNDDRDELAIRLVDLVGVAKFNLGDRDRARDSIAGYPRKFRSPWRKGREAELVQMFALHTGGTVRAPTPAGGQSFWMTEEGTLEQRECITAGPPSEMRVNVTLPKNARLEVSPAVLEPAGIAIQFSLAVIAEGKPTESIWKVRVSPKEARKWQPRSVDLAAFGGQKVDLVLSTSVAAPLPNEVEVTAPVAEGEGEEKRTRLPLAVWGDPVILASREPRVAGNVVFIVVDALRADAIASMHGNVVENAALPPLDARLPKVSGLTPAIDQLVADGVSFRRAYSVASWTRPGTLALLSGKRSSELGVGTAGWVVSPAEALRFYRSAPPLLPHLLRSHGVRSRALVNNFFMLGHADVGLDMGFEALDDFRYGTADTDAITKGALAYLEAHKKERFLLFLNYNSPHAPYVAPPECLARLPKRDDAGGDKVRAYMAEACKDDMGIAQVIKKIDDIGLREETLIVLSADHGETLSSAHAQVGIDGVALRFHHAASNFEETIHIPIILRYPAKLPKGKAIDVRVRSTDIVPTILDLFDLPQVPVSGRSLLPLVRGVERDDRPVLSEGRGPRGLISGNFHYLQYDRPSGSTTPPPGSMLFDLSTDPGERRNIVTERADVVARMREQVLSGAVQEAPPSSSEPRLAFRFSGAGKVKHVRASIRFEKAPNLVPVGIAPQDLRIEGTVVEVALSTVPDAVIGFDAIGVQNSVQWQFYFNDVPADNRELGGQYGLPLRLSRGGAKSRDAFSELTSSTVPLIDPMLDDGIFISLLGRESLDESLDRGSSPEMQRALEDWGYATKKKSPK